MKTVELHSQAFGSKSNSAVVLVMGATESMSGWPKYFCEELARNGLFVIRYDHRDTGESSTGEFGELTYSVEDLAGDIFSVMDDHRVEKAHLVGMSLGGLLAQMAALIRPNRVVSLTLIGSEPLGWDGQELPHISEKFLAHFGKMSELDWANKSDVVEFRLEIDRLCSGSKYEFDERRSRAKFESDIERSTNIGSSFNHGALEFRNDWTGRYKDIEKPTLVIHGEEDPILPLPNGRAISAGFKRAHLIILDGVGHELPNPELSTIAGVISAFVQSDSQGVGT